MDKVRIAAAWMAVTPCPRHLLLKAVCQYPSPTSPMVNGKIAQKERQLYDNTICRI